MMRDTARATGEEPAGMPFDTLRVEPALSVNGELKSLAEWNLIIGCDMPFLTREWLGDLAARDG